MPQLTQTTNDDDFWVSPIGRTPTTILIAGSAQVTAEMMTFTNRVVQHAMKQGYMILVGDHPKGVDLGVLHCASGYPNLMVCAVGKNEKARSLAVIAGEKPVSKYGFEAYHARDEFMCAMADIGYFIWNGRSKGTKTGYDYMVSLYEKTVWLADFSQTPMTPTKIETGAKPPEPLPIQQTLFALPRTNEFGV